jgi:hypothetical protein
MCLVNRKRFLIRQKKKGEEDFVSKNRMEKKKEKKLFFAVLQDCVQSEDPENRQIQQSSWMPFS